MNALATNAYTDDELIDYGFGIRDDFPERFLDPVTYLESELYIAETGAPIVLVDEHKDVLREMFSRGEDGLLKYEIMLWSGPKKSGKTQIIAGVADWQAKRLPNGEIYIVGNDLKQADTRMNQAIRESLALNPRTSGIKPVRNTILLPNNTRIEAVPTDPAGEAGSNPTGIFWTEAWGAKQKKHIEMWSEMNLSSTRVGEAFKMMESYAGHSGESVILERFYDVVVRPENRHPTIPELYIKGRMIAYWCTRHIMPWQQGKRYEEFLATRELELGTSEFRRQYWNEWTSAVDAFIDIQLWRAREASIPPLDALTPVVIGLDAAVTSDCCALVMVSMSNEIVSVRRVMVWYPPEHGEIELEQVYNTLKELYAQYNVILTVYDPTQLESIAQRVRVEFGWIEKFNQGLDRLIADKLLKDEIINGRIQHGGDAVLDEHMLNANAKTDGDHLRIIKRHESAKIDAVIALSMAHRKIRDFTL